MEGDYIENETSGSSQFVGPTRPLGRTS